MTAENTFSIPPEEMKERVFSLLGKLEALIDEVKKKKDPVGVGMEFFANYLYGGKIPETKEEKSRYFERLAVACMTLACLQATPVPTGANGGFLSLFVMPDTPPARREMQINALFQMAVNRALDYMSRAGIKHPEEKAAEFLCVSVMFFLPVIPACREMLSWGPIPGVQGVMIGIPKTETNGELLN